MNPDLLERAEALSQLDDRVGKFGSKFNVYPQVEAGKLYDGILRLEEEIPTRPNPANREELFEQELKRKLGSRVITLGNYLTGEPLTLEDVIAMYGLPQEDLDDIKDWLVANKATTQAAIERLFQETAVESYEYDLPTDIPMIRLQAEGYAASQIANYHQKLGGLFESLSRAGNYLHRVVSVPTTEGRSYFQSKARRVAISLGGICYELEDGTIQLRERELIRIFGHEGMGHALQRVITDSSDHLPSFIRESNTATIASEESVTQHFERRIFEDLRGSRKTQRDLHIADNFDEIYAEEKDTQQISDYNRNLFRYGILVLADKSLGDPLDPEVINRRIELLGEVALNPGYARNTIERNRYKYDPSGNLESGLMMELRYAAHSVAKALEIFSAAGFDYTDKDERGLIDMTFLRGYYTPLGFIQKAQLVAAGQPI